MTNNRERPTEDAFNLDGPAPAVATIVFVGGVALILIGAMLVLGYGDEVGFQTERPLTTGIVATVFGILCAVVGKQKLKK